MPVGVVPGAELPLVVSPAPVVPVEPLGGGIAGAVATGPVAPVEPVEPVLGEAGGAVVSVPVVSVGPVRTVGSVWDWVRPGSGVEVVPVLGVFAGVVVAGVTGGLLVEASSSVVPEVVVDFLVAVFCVCCFFVAALAGR